jgi:hypothetical protein
MLDRGLANFRQLGNVGNSVIVYVKHLLKVYRVAFSKIKLLFTAINCREDFIS